MAKKVEAYNDVAHEQDSRRMMEHINCKSAEWESAEDIRSKKQLEEREKMRLSIMGHCILKSAGALLIAYALHKAMNAELIAPVLATPLSYFCAIYFGWCTSRFATFAKKVRG